jgi:hypothetical protein
MQFELFPFTVTLQTSSIAGWSLWSLALYVALFPLGDWLIERLVDWFNFAERSLYQSQKEFDATRSVRESVNHFYASLASITPFLILGAICTYGVEHHFGSAWAINGGLLACGGCAIYELGRRAGQAS